MSRTKIAWDDTYKEGAAYLQYPREPIVVSYHRIKKMFPENYSFLDYGFGSGNHIEFMIDKAEELYGIEVSNEAINMTSKRLEVFENFKKENLVLSNGDFIKEFENKFDFIIAWNSIYYNTQDTIKDTIDNLYKYLKKDGVLIASLPTYRSLFKKHSIRIDSSTFKLTNGISEQEGCNIVIPKDEEEFKSYFKQFNILDLGHEEKISYKIDDFHSHYYGILQK